MKRGRLPELYERLCREGPLLRCQLLVYWHFRCCCNMLIYVNVAVSGVRPDYVGWTDAWTRRHLDAMGDGC